jgi:hypothetical protein
MLMRLRFALDTREFYHDIDKDIQDLYPYPERLTFTYPDEWKSFIRQQLIKRDISEEALQHWLVLQAEPDADQTLASDTSLPAALFTQVKVLAAWVAESEPRFIEAKAVVNEVQRIQSAPDVTAITPLFKQQLNKLLDE